MKPWKINQEQILKLLEQETTKYSYLSTTNKLTLTTDMVLTKGDVFLVYHNDTLMIMRELVKYCPEELNWYATVYKEKVGEDISYHVKDVFVFEQQVTAAHCITTDQGDIELGMLPDDKFHHLRYQGHSHVNMGTTPSAVDESMYDTLIDDLIENEGENQFFVFHIANKRGDDMLRIVDIEENIVFEKADITVTYPGHQNTLDLLSNKIIKRPVTTTVTTAAKTTGKETGAKTTGKKRGRPKKGAASTKTTNTGQLSLEDYRKADELVDPGMRDTILVSDDYATINGISRMLFRNKKTGIFYIYDYKFAAYRKLTLNEHNYLTSVGVRS